ncbi:PP2C domain-containing protein [Cephalotus follicularis]|uniref:PP2C domain-containing protein n=1 Tax=Cephalotus follicularis TaxID=3775 RepID=A0A1Q3C9I3_CEPFO|nr:PP2C domain-containing protein [Cephalotus follicularis]
MGGCFSKGFQEYGGGSMKQYEGAMEDDIRIRDGGSLVRLQGSSRYTSMFTQQGRKGINQDAMTVWENFSGEKDTYFCGVFDGHGPSGHKIARHVRDILPSKLYSAIKMSHLSTSKYGDTDSRDYNGNGDNSHDHFLSSWESSLIKSFKEMDEQLCHDPTIDGFCSGTTAVTVIKQGDHLIVANLGDSRAVLCTRDSTNQLVPVQLTNDLKPNLPSECERIRNCKGRVFSLDEEPDVLRIWMPEENYPGLAMSRAFADFCLKDYGLISIPEVSYRKLTSNDEFVVLATDGIWDVLTDSEVISIVDSATKRSTTAQLLVHRAVKAWRVKFPGCKIDDCAVICLFLKNQPLLSKSVSEVTEGSINNLKLAISHRSGSIRGEGDHESGNGKEESNEDDGVSRVNSLVNISVQNRKRPEKATEGLEA